MTPQQRAARVQDAANSIASLGAQIRIESYGRHGVFAPRIEQLAGQWLEASASGLSGDEVARLREDGEAVVLSIGDRDLALTLSEIVGRLNPLWPMTID